MQTLWGWRQQSGPWLLLQAQLPQHCMTHQLPNGPLLAPSFLPKRQELLLPLLLLPLLQAAGMSDSPPKHPPAGPLPLLLQHQQQHQPQQPPKPSSNLSRG
jgi:hypothetical protein